MNISGSFIEVKNTAISMATYFTIERNIEYKMISKFQNISLFQNFGHQNYYFLNLTTLQQEKL